jgi:hypothetical protein
LELVSGEEGLFGYVGILLDLLSQAIDKALEDGSILELLQLLHIHITSNELEWRITNYPTY